MDYFLDNSERKYKKHFLCFHCKKVTTEPNLMEIACEHSDEELLIRSFTPYISENEKKYLSIAYFSRNYYCSSCLRTLVQVPENFPVPHKNSNKWKFIQSYWRAKGYLRKDLPFQKKKFLNLLQFEIQNTQNRLNKLFFFTKKNENYSLAEKRFLTEIKNISQEMQKWQNGELSL